MIFKAKHKALSQRIFPGGIAPSPCINYIAAIVDIALLATRAD